MVSNIIPKVGLAALLLAPATCMAAEYASEQNAWQSQGSGLSDPTGGNPVLGLQRWRVLTKSDNYSLKIMLVSW